MSFAMIYTPCTAANAREGAMFQLFNFIICLFNVFVLSSLCILLVGWDTAMPYVVAALFIGGIRGILDRPPA
jgi:hypothetical protein